MQQSEMKEVPFRFHSIAASKGLPLPNFFHLKWQITRSFYLVNLPQISFSLTNPNESAS